ncbi:MAG: hypothetical protein ACE5PT_02760 [Gemmatimonadales bacterium]
MYPEPTTERVDWYVFDVEDEALGSVSVPAGATVLDASVHHVLLLSKSAMEVETVELYRVERAGPR